MSTVRRLRGIDLDLLVALLALLEAESVSEAARALGVTQPTMSHALGRLRTLFDDPLLVRQGRRMVRTPRAAALAGPLAEALAQLSAAIGDAPVFDPATARVRVRIGVGDLGATTGAPVLLAWIARHAPGVEVDLVLSTGVDDPRLASGDLDVIIGASLDDLEPDRGRRLWTSPLVGLVRAGHPFAGGRPTVHAFERARHAIVTAPVMADGIVERSLRAQGHACRVAVRAPYWLVLPGVLRDSDLVAVVPRAVAGPLGEPGGLATFTPPVALPDHVLWLAWSPARGRETVIAWLRDVIGRLVREQVTGWEAQAVRLGLG